MRAAATPEDGVSSEAFSWELILVSAAEMPIGGPLGGADIDMSAAYMTLELHLGTGSTSNMAGDDEQVLHLRWALELLETYDAVLLLLLAQLHIRNQSVSLHKPH